MGLFDRVFRSARSSGSAEADAVFRKIYALMTDEAVQNRAYSPARQAAMAAGGGVDEVAPAIGGFGQGVSNPIPVNGPLGELVYLSNLRLPSGVPIMGHRLGSIEEIDVYETVAFDGSRWDLFFFDCYHTRKSRKMPPGYKATSEPERFLLATNVALAEFPASIREGLRECSERVIGTALVSPALPDEPVLRSFKRPPEHSRAVHALRLQEGARLDLGTPNSSETPATGDDSVTRWAAVLGALNEGPTAAAMRRGETPPRAMIEADIRAALKSSAFKGEARLEFEEPPSDSTDDSEGSAQAPESNAETDEVGPQEEQLLEEAAQEAELEERESELQAREAELEEREGGLQAREAELQAWDAELGARDTRLDAYKSRLAARGESRSPISG